MTIIENHQQEEINKIYLKFNFLLKTSTNEFLSFFNNKKLNLQKSKQNHKKHEKEINGFLLFLFY